MKYYMFFHMVTGHDVRVTITLNDEADFEKFGDEYANRLVSNKFLHFVEDGKFIIVNMQNVAYIRITEAS